MSIHMPPYYNSIIRGVSTVMVSYSSWNGKKMHANHFLVTDILKNKLKFRVSWSLQMLKILLFMYSRQLHYILKFELLPQTGFCDFRLGGH